MSIFFWLLLVIALIVWATVRLNLHPFLALLTGAIAMGFITGLEAPVLIGTISDGFGSTLRSIGIVIAAGAIIGEYLERSGGAKVLANRILEKTGEKNAPLAMSLTGYIVSRSEEHTSELQSRGHLVCRLLLEKKNEMYNGE